MGAPNPGPRAPPLPFLAPGRSPGVFLAILLVAGKKD